MKINLDRLCKLAGVESDASAVLSESSNRSYHEEDNSDEVQFRYGGKDQLSEAPDADEKSLSEMMDEMMGPPMEEMEEEDMGGAMEEYAYEEGMGHDHDVAMEEDANEGKGHDDEMVEVDEAMLVQEIRRARQMLAEARDQAAQSEETLQEQQLRKIVSEEVDNLMKDLNLTAGWVYGNNKPQNSNRGVVNTAFPGIGFKNSK